MVEMNYNIEIGRSAVGSGYAGSRGYAESIVRRNIDGGEIVDRPMDRGYERSKFGGGSYEMNIRDADASKLSSAGNVPLHIGS